MSKVYTVRVQYTRGGKIYDFATRSRLMGLDKTMVYSYDDDQMVEVYIHDVIVGITPKATKWRTTGQLIDNHTRSCYPTVEETVNPKLPELTEGEVSLSEFTEAINVFRKMQASGAKIGFTLQGNLYDKTGYHTGADSKPPTTNWMESVFNAVERARKAEVEEDKRKREELIARTKDEVARIEFELQRLRAILEGTYS